ncbi:MAG: hypothetical protein ACYTG6_15530 [Planctomycetota bacterium]
MKRAFVWAPVLAVAMLIVASPASASLRYFDTDRLDEGSSHTIQLRFQKDAHYMVVAIASKGGIDFDITVIDPNGNKVIQSDATNEDIDWVRFRAPYEGDYRVRITAYKGTGWYELTVFNTDGY